jgi:hypothetical protein
LEAKATPSISPYTLKDQLKEEGENNFRALNPGAFLLVKRYPTDKEEFMFPKTVLSPVTDMEAIKSKGMGERVEADQIPLPGTVIPLLKTDRNAYLSRITIGRAKNNDIIIRASKISKVHCAFVIHKKYFELVDMGSANGTTLNGVLLKKNKSVRLSSRDLVSIHRHEFEFLEMKAFIEMLRELP